MKRINVLINIKDLVKLESIPTFIPAYKYLNDKSIRYENEWGKVEVNDFELIFYVHTPKRRGKKVFKVNMR